MSSHTGQTRQQEILIVDDTPENLRLLFQLLSEEGYKVRAVTSGVRALEAARAAPPDLILLDIMMLEMTGYEVCERLKLDPATHDIPIIFISALGQVHNKLRAFTLGGVDYITKPFQPEEVIARIQTHTTLRNLQRELEVANKELAQRLRELEAVNAELQASNEALDTYAHTVAHDLKNPLALILGYAQLLETKWTTMTDQELENSHRLIARNSRKMLNIIDELLLLASVRNIDEVGIGPLDMEEIVSEAQERLADLIAHYQAEIILPPRWPSGMGYAPWIEEVWVNYLSNGIKYGGTPPRVQLGATALANGTVRYWVQDNGDGLAPQERARLFRPFERLDQARAKGHGLGLSIVKQIVERLGGAVGVESVAGQGCTFSFTLPAIYSK